MIPHDAGLPDPKSSLPSPSTREVYPIAGRVEGPHPTRPAAPPPNAPGLSAAPDIFSLLIALRRRWVSAVLLGGTLGAIAAIGMWYLLTPKNIGYARIQISFSEKPLLNDHLANNNDFKTYMKSAASQIASRTVILAALKHDKVRSLNLESTESDPPQMIDDDLKTEIKEDNEYLTVMFSHYDPVVATTVVQAIKDVYISDVYEAERLKKANALTKLEKVFGEKVEGLKTLKDNLKTVGKNLGVADPHRWREEHQEVVTALRDAKQQKVQAGFKLVDARANLEVFEARMKAMGKRAGPDKPKTEKELVADILEDLTDSDREAVALREEARRYEKEIELYLSRGFSPNYVSVSASRRKADLARKNLAKRKGVLMAKAKRVHSRAVKTMPTAGNDDPALIRDQLRKQVDALKNLDEGLAKDIKILETQAAKMPVQAVEYEQLADAIKREEVIVDDMGKKVAREKVEMDASPRVTSAQDAALMKKEIKKQILATAAAPLVLICAVCMGLAYLEYRKRRVRTASEISNGLGIRVVGAVPRTANLERQLVNASGETVLEGTPVMESIDAIRTRLLHEADARSMRLVMVTSATEGEGKTTLACHLASSLARAGRKTLLLDGDLRRPTVHELFEMPMQPGFSEVLLGEVEMGEAAQETHQENLSVIPAGQWDREVLLALARDGLEGVFEKLADEFDFIIIDSHPVLAATDSLLLGRQVDAVILSVLREVSQMGRVFAAQQQLTGLGIRVLGAVVNGTDPEEVFNAPAATASVA